MQTERYSSRLVFWFSQPAARAACVAVGRPSRVDRHSAISVL